VPVRRPARRQPRWQRRPDARPEEILAAAQVVFGEQGFAGARLDEVARRAGVSKGTLYLYFDSKETLFRDGAGPTSAVAAGEISCAPSGPARDLLLEPVRRMGATTRHRDTSIARLVQSEPTTPRARALLLDEVVLRGRRLPQSVLTAASRAASSAPTSTGRVPRAAAPDGLPPRRNLPRHGSRSLTDDQVLEGISTLPARRRAWPSGGPVT
jgi:AcrR family transcriptional regulator